MILEDMRIVHAKDAEEAKSKYIDYWDAKMGEYDLVGIEVLESIE